MSTQSFFERYQKKNGKFRYVIVWCKKCGKSVKINTENRNFYDRNIRDNFTCFRCRER